MVRARQVLQDLHTVGISLPAVPVSLVSSLPGPEDGRCVKLTTRGMMESRTARIEIRSGLGPTRFGHVVAHEHTHALLHLNGGPAPNPGTEEGVCELIAVVWLTRRSTGAEVLRDIWANTHPAYGGEMRRIVKLARRDGVGTVLERVLRTGAPE